MSSSAHQSLTLQEAERLIQLPLKCLQNEFPYKAGHTTRDANDTRLPREMHPAFYGCFDWHSAVHGHWVLVKLLSTYPALPQATEAHRILRENLSIEHIRQELLYFQEGHNKSFERTYGWAWLLKLAEELHGWDSDTGKELTTNLQPLINEITQKYLDYLPKLNYPIRVGTHSNTAFGLSFAYDYAKKVNNTKLQALIEERAKYFYGSDQNCPLTWEPSGHDFLSPCLEEAALMSKVLSEEDYIPWLKDFMPTLWSPNFSLQPATVSDRSDGHLVHLDGLNFSRAWCLYALADTAPELAHLKPIADQHIKASIDQIVDGQYEGEHWLASFALYALSQKEN